MKSGGPALVGCWAVSGIGVAQGVTRLPVLTASQSTLYQTLRMTTMIVFTTVFLFMSMMGRWILNMTQFKALTFGTPLRWDQWFFSLIKCNNALQWGGIVKRYCYDPDSLCWIIIIIKVGIWVIIMYAMQGWPPILADAFEGSTWQQSIVQCHLKAPVVEESQTNGSTV